MCVCPVSNNKPTTGSYKKITTLDGKTQFKSLGQGTRDFRTPDLASEHFIKHNKGIMSLTGRNSYGLDQYLSEANHIIKTGTYIPQSNAYVKYIGPFKGQLRFGYVGLDRASGVITTFHTKSLKDLIKIAPNIFSK